MVTVPDPPALEAGAVEEEVAGASVPPMVAEIMVAQNIVFGILAVVMVAAAFRLVTTQNVVRAALFLAIVLAGAAGLYILLAAEFVAWVQVLVYIGAVVVLLLFGVMLTRAPIGRDADLDNDQRLLGALVALFLFGALGAVLLDAFGDQEVGTIAIRRTAEVSDSIFGDYVIPFEVSSVLLLAALVGAVALAAEGTRTAMYLNQFLLLAAVLFCLGVYGVLARKNAVLVLMSIELMLNAVNINLIAFGAFRDNVIGQVFSLFVIAIAAAEVGVGLAIVLLIFRNRADIDLDELDLMKG